MAETVCKVFLNVMLSSLDLTVEGSTKVYFKKDCILQQLKGGWRAGRGEERPIKNQLQ